MVPPASDRAPPTPPYSGFRLGWRSFRVRGCHPLWRAFPGVLRYDCFFHVACPTTPRAPRRPRFGLVPFRSPLLGESLLFSFPPTTGMFRFVGFASAPSGCRACARRVAPFGHLRINGRSRLPADFRGLPRPSSPPGAKASSVRPRSLLAIVFGARIRCATPRSCVSLLCLLSLPSCQRTVAGSLLSALVENVGLEPTTPGLQSRCSSQLSQSPYRLCVVPGRLELPTPTLSVWCSNRLSYGTPSCPASRGRALLRAPPALVCAGQHNGALRLQLGVVSLQLDACRQPHRSDPPERRCSSRTFRYGYLVTT